MSSMHPFLLFSQKYDTLYILWRALGQGAFGEVYQGMLKSKNDPSETNVAVKTLPELSTNQGNINILYRSWLWLEFDAHGEI